MHPARADLPHDLTLEPEPPRVRFAALRHSRSHTGRCRVEVELRGIDGNPVIGACEAEPSAVCDQRAAAAATVRALAEVAVTGHRFELLGVKNVRAFDQTIVLVLLQTVAGDAPPRLVGAAVGDDDLLRATVRAVLNASNRVLWRRA